MSITDELREWVNERFVGLLSSEWVRDLNAIADRIDVEYAAYRAAVDAIPKEYVKLPVDADGIPIHVGDELTNGIDLPAKVRGMALGEDGWTVSPVSFISTRVDPSTLRHVKPDSWERIIRDIRTIKGCGSTDEFMERHCAELVERCRRLAGDAE